MRSIFVSPQGCQMIALPDYEADSLLLRDLDSVFVLLGALCCGPAC